VLGLNWGTLKNRQRVMGGFFANENMSEAEAINAGTISPQYAEGLIESALENLTDKDWDFVQGIWDLFESYWPQVAAVEKEASGTTPGKEQSAPVLTASGKKLRGGYFPIRYNPLKSLTAARHDSEKNVKSLTETPYGRASVAHGYTHARAEVVNRQVSLDLETIARHLNEVAHDLTHRIAVRDVSRIINEKTLAAHLEHVLGRENYEQLNPWLQHIANAALTEKQVTAVEDIVKGMTTNIAAAYLGFKFSVGIKQFFGLGPAAGRLGALRMTRAMWGYLTDAGHWSEIAEDIYKRSAYMSDRAQNFDRDLYAAVADRAAAKLTGSRAGVRDMLFWWAGEMDMLISIPTWRAAYEQALNKFASSETDTETLEKKAVEYADMVVRTTQNAGSPKDLAMIQRRGAIMKLATMFYTALGRIYNATREEYLKGHGVKDFPRLAAHVLTVYTFPFLLGALLSRDSGDDDDGLFWWFGKGTVGEMLSPLVGLGAVFDYISGNRSATIPVIGDAMRNAKKIVDLVAEGRAEDKDMNWGGLTRETIDLAGPLAALPSKQILASYRGILAAMEKWNERSGFEKMTLTPWDVLMGPERRWRKKRSDD
jgi:hypothetical protein